MNRNVILFNLREAQEEITKTITDLETEVDYSEATFSIAMSHVYHHVNTAWNARNSTEEQWKNCSDEDFNKWGGHPNDLWIMQLE